MAEPQHPIDAWACPAPLPASDRVLLGHGSGGKLTAELIRDLFLPAFDNPVLARLDDQAIVSINGQRLAFTTDSFVVKPLFFPGGDIGSLAVYGTVNDLAMGGAQPLFLSVAFILEEGLPMQTLRRVTASLRQAASCVGVEVVTGDTKVVEKGSGDGLFLNTSGLGVVPEGVELSAARVRPGDRVLLSGSIGEHGIAILAQREGLEFDSPVESDSAPLHTLVASMLAASKSIRCLRDPTRGGLSSALNEIAARAGVGIEIDERAIPVREDVKGACELLGLDPLYVANEGKLVAIVAPEAAETVLEAMRRHPLGKDAALIGTVTEAHPRMVTMRTVVGPTRVVDMLAGDQLPRIC
ncbi:MAG: hydrogenase expression/formation protein HypE [Bryobacterales bacterium]|nr:hydrogenase expression/formation protein HypE [Bryobacteraceae bacterium]MDW8353254.1 hydrogenase expression/formation protein HypE [Bryobacterales bacterium]